MYYIRVTFYFFKDSLNREKDGPLRKDNRIMSFATKDEAINYLREYSITKPLTAQKYTIPAGEYYPLRHGEYAAPDYQIRKFRQS